MLENLRIWSIMDAAGVCSIACVSGMKYAFNSAFPAVRGPGRATYCTGRLSVVRPGRPNGKTAVFGQGGGPYRVRHASSRQGDGLQEDGLQGTAGDARGPRE